MAKSLDRGITWRSYKIADADALPYYPDLVVHSSGELAATWFSGAGESLHFHACLIRFGYSADQPRVIVASPMQTDSWTKTDEPDHVLVRTTAGEYLQPILLERWHSGSRRADTGCENTPLWIHFLEVRGEVSRDWKIIRR